ncbi:MAG: carboxypeptidase-like regulatory domain-containing protein [Bacteroidota bacterium]|nr:carboxypeptidase-like regulatory domain-containing protein [Bacteroidota bacterium]
MRHPRTAAIAAAVLLLFAGLPGRAQYAFNNVAPPALASAGSGSEESPKAAAYKTVHGVVQSRQGVLPGATVWLHGSRTMVVTNAEGEFELRVPANAQIIELTCGYAGLQDEVLRLVPVQALGSVYLLRPHTIK